MSITLRGRAIIPGTTLYDSNFTTDRTADFSSGVIYDPTVVYATLRPVDADYLYANLAGAIGIGVGSSGSINCHIDIPVKRGDQPIVYMLLWNASSVICDITYSWLDSSLTQVGLSVLTTTQNHAIEKSDIGIVPADGYLRINWQKKNFGTGGCWVCALRVQNGVGYRPASFQRNSLQSKRRPSALCSLIPVGKSTTIDFSPIVTNADQVGTTEPDMSTNGKSLILTPRSTSDTGAGEYMGVDYKVAAYNKGHRSTDILTCYKKVINPIPFTLNSLGAEWHSSYYVETSRWFSIDFISRVQGGLWPYSAKIIAKPGWLIEGISGTGWLRGKAPSLGQASADIIVEVIDSLGQTVRFADTITVVATRSRLPDVTISGGTPTNPTNIYSAAGLAAASTSRPFVVKLARGTGHFVLGTPWKYMRPNAAPLIVVGGGVDTNTTFGSFGSQGLSGVIFENVEFNELTYMGNPDNLGDRSKYTATIASPPQAPSRGHVFFYDCTSKGWKSPDLSLEPNDLPEFCYRVRTDAGFSGKVIYSATPDRDNRPEWLSSVRPDSAWVRSNYPSIAAEFGSAYYNGGFQITAPAILENCHVEQACMAYVTGTHSSALINCTAQDIRTDVFRLHGGTAGLYIDRLTTPVRSHSGNRGTDEHPDLFQGLASGYPTTLAAGSSEDIGNAAACAKRVEIRDSALIASTGRNYTPLSIQGVQINTGWSSDANNPRRDPRLSYEDIWFYDTLIVADAPNIVRATFGDWHFHRCWMTNNFDSVRSMSSLNSATRCVTAGAVEVQDCIIIKVSDESEVAPLESGNLLIGNLPPSAAMPDIANTGLTLLQRHRIDPAWAAMNPGKGPQWLISL